MQNSQQVKKYDYNSLLTHSMQVRSRGKNTGFFFPAYKNNLFAKLFNIRSESPCKPNLSKVGNGLFCQFISKPILVHII